MRGGLEHKRARLTTALVAIAALGTCAAGGHRSAKSAPSSAAPAPPRRLARLHYHRPGLAPLPFVRATFGGEPSWALVDTGAGVHVASTWLARRAGVHTEKKGDNVEDHARVALAADRTDLSAVSLDGWGKLGAGSLLVVDARDGSLAARAGVGLYLSPQGLADGRAIVLDFERGEMRTADEGEVERALATRRYDLLARGVRACDGTFGVAATVDGQPATLTLDTGANTSTLYATTAAGRALEPRATPSRMRAESASGPVTSKTYRGARVKMGAWSTTTDLELISGGASGASSCPSDGVLGFDELRACVLVFGPAKDTLRARCGAR